ncbi:ABC transporter permease [Streptomyces sp. NPDC048659]|uniref:ABC transporter permease n=1 Tax=Streptomyces sp. NPDC048659 TaxID=3155489 RepID=UPI003426EEE7
MLSVYRIELRRSPLLTAFPVMIAVDLAVLFGRSRYWIGVWPEASVAAQIVTLFLGPVLAGVSAWQAGRASRAGMPEFLLAAARPGWRAEAARLAATLTLGLLAYAIGCLTAAAVSLGEAGPGFLWPSYLLLGASTLVVFASVGHLAGRWWPSPGFTPVVCALGCFVSMLSLPFRFNVLAGPPDTRLSLPALAVRLVIAAAFAVLAVTAPPPARRAGRRGTPPHVRGVAALAAVAVVAAVAVAPAAGELRVERTAAADTPLCARADEDSPRVCVWPEHRTHLPELTEMARRLDRPAAQPWIKAPDEFHEYGLRRTRWGGPRVRHRRRARTDRRRRHGRPGVQRLDRPVHAAPRRAWRPPRVAGDRPHPPVAGAPGDRGGLRRAVGGMARERAGPAARERVVQARCPALTCSATPASTAPCRSWPGRWRSPCSPPSSGEPASRSRPSARRA